jgi:hypothetical protein
LRRSKGELNHELLEVPQSLAIVRSGGRHICTVNLQEMGVARIITLGRGSWKDNVETNRVEITALDQVERKQSPYGPVKEGRV